MPGFGQLLILLLAAVVVVPLSARAGLGAVLGYLAVGVLMGPWGLQVIAHVDEVLHVAEFGVVLLLFVIGLELRPSRLWAMRKAIFGVGMSQILISALLLSGFALLLGDSLTTAIVIGLVLALSSTAFALQLIAERGEMTARWGRASFGILLAQDLAVVPLLALLPLLGSSASGGGISLQQGALSVAALLAVVVGGRFLLRLMLRVAARSQVREILTATALLVAFGTAYLLDAAGLSLALGAFMAGVLLADSEFRHQLEADIEPFKGLLLGLFFMAVGMSLNLGLLVSEVGTVLLVIAGIIVIKFAVLFGLARVSGLGNRDATKMGIALSQGGEFAFVLFGVALAADAMTSAQFELQVLAVSLSMVVTPLLFLIYDKLLSQEDEDAPEFDSIDEHQVPVIIVGFGRFGQVVARMLSALQIRFTALDASHQQVDFVRQYGNEIYYGDGSRIDLLEAAGAADAKLLVLAIDEVEQSLATAQIIREHFPTLKIYARARNRKHAYQLMDLGVEVIRRETLLSAVDLGREVLVGLGMARDHVNQAAARFVEHDQGRLEEHQSLHDDEAKMRDVAKQSARELEEMFARDAAELTKR